MASNEDVKSRELVSCLLYSTLYVNYSIRYLFLFLFEIKEETNATQKNRQHSTILNKSKLIKIKILAL